MVKRSYTFVSEPWDNPESSIASSQDSSETPPGCVEISSKNQQPRIRFNSFSFEIKPVSKLKVAVKALCDPSFNPKGLALIDICSESFNLAFRNSETQVHGCITVVPSDKNEYFFSEPFKPKMINLKSVLSVLDNATSDDTVTIRHVHGSSELRFKFGTDSEFRVQLTEPDSDIGNIPVLNRACYIVIKSQHLREMIPLLLQDEIPQQVFVHVKTENVIITVGGKKWEARLTPVNRKDQLNSGKERSVLFQWPHVDSLRNVVILNELFRFGFESSDVPASTLQLKFFVTEGCKLVFTRFNSCFKKTYSFEFQVKLAPALKCALKSLADSDFTRRPYNLRRVRIGWPALVEVNNEGFVITVRNSKSGVSAFLQFKACDLINFKCIKPLEKKMIDINQIGFHVLQEKDDDILAVYHVDGSNEISFESGKQYFSSLNELDAEFVGVPLNLNNVCSVEIPSEDFGKLIPLMTENRKHQTVSLEIKDGTASFSVKQRKLGSFHDKKLLGQSHNVTFKWPHPDALMLALKSSKHFLLHLQDDPSDSITLQFDLQVGTILYHTGVQRLGLA